MSSKTTTKIQPGDEIYWLRTGIIFRLSESIHAVSEVSQRGSTLTITESIIAASADRHGANSWLDLVDDPEAQSHRWGSVVFARGIAPDGISTYEPGTTEAEVAFTESRTAAWAVTDPEHRAEALAALNKEFGSPATSRTVRTERGEFR